MIYHPHVVYQGNNADGRLSLSTRPDVVAFGTTSGTFSSALPFPASPAVWQALRNKCGQREVAVTRGGATASQVPPATSSSGVGRRLRHEPRIRATRSKFPLGDLCKAPVLFAATLTANHHNIAADNCHHSAYQVSTFTSSNVMRRICGLGRLIYRTPTAEFCFCPQNTTLEGRGALPPSLLYTTARSA